MLADHSVVHRRFVQRSEVLTLEVLDDRDLEGRVVVELLDERRDGREAGFLRRAPAALTGDELIPVLAERSDEDRLEDAMLADRGGKLMQGVDIEHGPRLVRIRLDVVDRNDANADSAPDVIR